MLQHLNYCRQMVKQFTDRVAIPSVAADMKAQMSHCIDLVRASQKFILPDGGRLYDDPEFRALDESETLSLPFPLIALEFARSDDFVEAAVAKGAARQETQPRKGLMFAREREDVIAITVVVWVEHAGSWVPYPEVAIPRVHYLDRAAANHGGRVGIRTLINQQLRFQPPIEDYQDEIEALLGMLNVLGCGNVRIEESRPSKTRKAMAAGRKGALPFDSYHLLTIDAPAADSGGPASGSHRSPREHLRRGHIRRLQDGRRIWVNAAVVAAGRGAGVVTKDYAIRRGKQQ